MATDLSRVTVTKSPVRDDLDVTLDLLVQPDLETLTPAGQALLARMEAEMRSGEAMPDALWDALLAEVLSEEGPQRRPDQDKVAS